MDRVDSVKIDRKALSVGSVLEPSDEKAYWLSKTPQERLQAAELMRQAPGLDNREYLALSGMGQVVADYTGPNARPFTHKELRWPVPQYPHRAIRGKSLLMVAATSGPFARAFGPTCQTADGWMPLF